MQFLAVLTIFLVPLFAARTIVAQNSCTAVAFAGQANASGNSCAGIELGDASQNAASFGACAGVTQGKCILTENSQGDCAIHLYSDSRRTTPITGGNTIMCGQPPDSVDFNSFQVECS